MTSKQSKGAKAPSKGQKAKGKLPAKAAYPLPSTKLTQPKRTLGIGSHAGPSRGYQHPSMATGFYSSDQSGKYRFDMRPFHDKRTDTSGVTLTGTQNFAQCSPVDIGSSSWALFSPAYSFAAPSQGTSSGDYTYYLMNPLLFSAGAAAGGGSGSATQQRLAAEARSYQYYRFKDVCLRWSTDLSPGSGQSGTMVSGGVTFPVTNTSPIVQLAYSPSPDISSGTYDDVFEISQLPGITQFPIWAPSACHEIKYRGDDYWWTTADSGGFSSAAGAIIRQCCQGFLSASISSFWPSWLLGLGNNTTVIGNMFLDYVVELFGPRPPYDLSVTLSSDEKYVQMALNEKQRIGFLKNFGGISLAPSSAGKSALFRKRLAMLQDAGDRKVRTASPDRSARDSTVKDGEGRMERVRASLTEIISDMETGSQLPKLGQ